MKKQNIRIALGQINALVGDFCGNAQKISAFIQNAQVRGADLVCFPELAVCGYPPEDLLLKPGFIENNIACVKKIAAGVGDIVVVVGFVDRDKSKLFNAAAVICKGRIRGIYRKVFLPNYGVFDEKRYFSPGSEFPVFAIGRLRFGVNICEDIWHLEGPAGLQAYRGARLIVNINASPYQMGKGAMREDILKKQARRHGVFIAYANLVGGQDELVFDGSSFFVDQTGRVTMRASSFLEDLLVADVSIPVGVSSKKSIFLKEASLSESPLVKRPKEPASTPIQEVYQALVLGLRDYVVKNGFSKIVLGLSGGIDSSLVAALAADAIGAENVLGVLMPSVFTSDASNQDAEQLARNLGIPFRSVPIQGIVDVYLKSLEGIFAGKAADITEENLQARVRGNIIMAVSNKFGHLALNTGNKSEVSCGYCTLYGDMAGGFGVIKDVPKTLVYQLAVYKNKKDSRQTIPERVFLKAPTAELRPNQLDSDSLPEYGLLDRILKLYIEEDKGLAQIVERGIDEDLAKRVIRLVDSSEYKRRQSAPGIKITHKAFGRDRRMPITNHYR